MLIECFDGKAHNHCLDDSSGPIVIGNKSFLLLLQKQEPDRQQAYETKVGMHRYRYQVPVSVGSQPKMEYLCRWRSMSTGIGSMSSSIGN